jgi:TRAP-type C4-dicarboxylate transport system permease small subunit
MSAVGESSVAHVFRQITKVSNYSLRAIGLTLIILGWLGELAIMLTRNFVNVEPGWTVELVTLALVYGSLLYVGLVSRHIGFTLVDRQLRKNKYLARITPLISMVIIGTLFVYSIQSVITSHQDGGTAIETPGFNYPNWLVVVVMPVVFLTLFIQLGHKFIKPNGTAAVVPPLEVTEGPLVSDDLSLD